MSLPKSPALTGRGHSRAVLYLVTETWFLPTTSSTRVGSFPFPGSQPCAYTPNLSASVRRESFARWPSATERKAAPFQKLFDCNPMV